MSSPPPTVGAAGAVRPHAPLWLLAMVTFSGTLAMHVFVPALPKAATDLGVGIATMQMTVSLHILGLALGQLAYVHGIGRHRLQPGARRRPRPLGRRDRGPALVLDRHPQIGSI